MSRFCLLLLKLLLLLVFIFYFFSAHCILSQKNGSLCQPDVQKSENHLKEHPRKYEIIIYKSAKCKDRRNEKQKKKKTSKRMHLHGSKQTWPGQIKSNQRWLIWRNSNDQLVKRDKDLANKTADKNARTTNTQKANSRKNETSF